LTFKLQFYVVYLGAYVVRNFGRFCDIFRGVPSYALVVTCTVPKQK
jgi:hypothetical protein